MIATSSESSYLSPAAKRQRAGTDDVKKSSPISRIESLPTEILQLIFFGSLNGNLLRASPRIAIKLSGSKTIYRTAFLVAFYHSNILELRKAFNFDYLLSDVELPIPGWEVRSMQKIVLDSRWCTFGWFKGLASELLDYAYNLYRNVYAKDLPPEAFKRLDEVLDGRENLLKLRYAGGGGTDANGTYIELGVDPFGLEINVWSEDEEEPGTDEACEKARRWCLHLRGVGSIRLRSGLLGKSYDDGDHFRLLVDRAILSIHDKILPQPAPTDPWEYRERAMLEAISNHDLDLLQELLEIDYFSWPEDAPFKVSPRLFIAAVQKHDLSALALFFQIDPTSLPRSDQCVIDRAAQLSKGSALLRQNRLHARMVRRRRRAGGEDFSEEFLKKAAQIDSWKEYQEHMNAAIFHYVRTGCLMKRTNPLSPNFFAQTITTSAAEVCESRIFGDEDEMFGEDGSGYIYDAMVEEGSNNSTPSDWPLTGESEIDNFTDSDNSELWDSEMDDFDMYDEGSVSEIDDEEDPDNPRPSAIDWTSVYLRAGRDWPLGMERKEHYHYMMP